jgi:hypothetical protein
LMEIAGAVAEKDAGGVEMNSDADADVHAGVGEQSAVSVAQGKAKLRTYE